MGAAFCLVSVAFVSAFSVFEGLVAEGLGKLKGIPKRSARAFIAFWSGVSSISDSAEGAEAGILFVSTAGNSDALAAEV